MEWLFTRPVVVTLAIIGALLSTLAPMLQGKGWLSERGAHRLNMAGYVVMGISMLFFIVAGFRT
jgi:hypothetical protein